MLEATETLWARVPDDALDAHILEATETLWARVPDDALDAHIRSYRGHPMVRCAAEPDAYTDDAADQADQQTAARVCGGCPIVAACLEQALRLERGSQESFGIRGGLNAADRRALIEARPDGAKRTFLPTTWSRPEVIAHLKSRGYTIAPNTWSAKVSRALAPQALVSSPHGAHWDVREVRQWDPKHRVTNQHTR